MRKTIFFVITFFLLSFLLFGEGKKLRDFEKIKIPPLNPIKTPSFEKITLDNGLKLFLFKDNEIPLIKIFAFVRGGKVNEEKVGEATLFGMVLRTGGTRSMDGDKVDEFLERIGASIESYTSDSFTTVTATMLTENDVDVIPLFSEFFTAPAFSQEKIDLAKTKMKSIISRRNDEVMQIGRREFMKLIYGKDSPYARQIEYDDVDNLTRDDIVNFYSKYFRPDETSIAVVGDFDKEKIKNLFINQLGKWNNPTPKPDYSLPKILEMKPSINFIEKNDVEQTTILLGHLGLKLDDPDYPAINILSEILGGGMASRIFVQVRTLKGLAYGAGGYMIPAYDHKGAFFFYTATKPETSVEALKTILEEIKKIKSDMVTDEELARAKDGYLNSFAFEFDSTDKIARRILTYNFYNYPENFNEILKSKIEKVTKEDVFNVAKKYLFDDKLSILVVGRKEVKDQLSSLGEVNLIDITIPEPKPKEVLPEPTEETLKTGKELLKNVAITMGEKEIKKISNISFRGNVSLKTQMGEFSTKQKGLIILPDKVHFEIDTPMGKIEQIIKGKEGYMVIGQKKKVLSEPKVFEILDSLKYSFGAIGLIKEFLQGKIDGQYIGEKEVKGVKTKLVVVRNNDKVTKLYIDINNLLYAIERKENTEEGPKYLIEVFSDYKEVKGVKIPFSSKTYLEDEIKGSSSYETIDTNIDVSESEEGLLGVK